MARDKIKFAEYKYCARVIKTMNPGDYVSLNGEDGNVWYGEVVGTSGDDLEVYFIEKGDNNVWSYSEEWHTVPKGSVVSRVLTESHVNVIAALKELGFRPLTDSTFVRLDETGVVPVGDEAFDADEDSVIGIHPEMQDFIVPDDECEPFTFASADNDFVRETHKAVRQFNAWNPTGEARRIKDYILNLEEKVIAMENCRTRLGEGLSYNHPPQ